MKKNAMGMAALLVGVVALGLAVIPGIALDRPFGLADEGPEEPPLPQEGPERGVTFKFKNFSATFGGNKKEEGEQPEAEPVPDKKNGELVVVLADPPPKAPVPVLKWLTISAMSCALVGLFLGPISWVRERQPALSGSAMAICCAAILWQYVLVGIALGVALAVLVVFLGHFAD